MYIGSYVIQNATRKELTGLIEKLMGQNTALEDYSNALRSQNEYLSNIVQWMDQVIVTTSNVRDNARSLWNMVCELEEKYAPQVETAVPVNEEHTSKG